MNINNDIEICWLEYKKSIQDIRDKTYKTWSWFDKLVIDKTRKFSEHEEFIFKSGALRGMSFIIKQLMVERK